MKFEKFKYENISPEGLIPNDGGQITVSGLMLNSTNNEAKMIKHSVDLDTMKDSCEEVKNWLAIVVPRTEDGVVEGIKVEFDTIEEMIQAMPNYSVLVQQQKEEKAKKVLSQNSNLIGLCLKPSSTSRYKILSIDDSENDGSGVVVTVINVFMDEHSKKASITNDDYTTLGLPLNCKVITQEEFDEFSKRAYEIITNKPYLY